MDVLVLLVVLPFWGEKGRVRKEEVGAEKLHLEEAQGHLPVTTSPLFRSLKCVVGLQVTSHGAN